MAHEEKISEFNAGLSTIFLVHELREKMHQQKMMGDLKGWHETVDSISLELIGWFSKDGSALGAKNIEEIEDAMKKITIAKVKKVAYYAQLHKATKVIYKHAYKVWLGSDKDTGDLLLH